MQDFNEFAARVAKDWSHKTLEELRTEADRETTGISSYSIREDGGKRAIIILCLTDLDQIARLEKAMNFADDGVIEDWNKLTLADVAFRSGGGDSLSFEGLKDEYGRRSAIVLTAVGPKSVHLMEIIFTLPQ